MCQKNDKTATKLTGFLFFCTDLQFETSAPCTKKHVTCKKIIDFACITCYYDGNRKPRADKGIKNVYNDR